LNAFAPQSPLEQALLDAQEERLSQDAFLEQFMNAPVVILADRPVSEAGEWHPETRPLLLGTPKGWPALAVFSHPDRIEALPAELREGHAHLLGATAGWVLQGTGTNLGLVMNPGSPVGFELPPTELARLKAAFGMTTPAGE
jgi:hypothetical protein